MTSSNQGVKGSNPIQTITTASFMPRNYYDIDYSTVKGIVLMMLQLFTRIHLCLNPL